MSELKKGDLVNYRLGDTNFRAQVYGFVEGWPELLFADGSTAVVPPSKAIPRSQDEGRMELR